MGEKTKLVVSCILVVPAFIMLAFGTVIALAGVGVLWFLQGTVAWLFQEGS